MNDLFVQIALQKKGIVMQSKRNQNSRSLLVKYFSQLLKTAYVQKIATMIEIPLTQPFKDKNSAGNKNNNICSALIFRMFSNG